MKSFINSQINQFNYKYSASLMIASFFKYETYLITNNQRRHS